MESRNEIKMEIKTQQAIFMETVNSSSADGDWRAAERRALQARGGGVEAEGAEEGGAGADFREGGVDRSGGGGFDVEVELVFERATVDGAAFDFLEVDAMAGERFESGEECAGLVGETESDGHFVGCG